MTGNNPPSSIVPDLDDEGEAKLGEGLTSIADGGDRAESVELDSGENALKEVRRCLTQLLLAKSKYPSNYKDAWSSWHAKFEQAYQAAIEKNVEESDLAQLTEGYHALRRLLMVEEGKAFAKTMGKSPLERIIEKARQKRRNVGLVEAKKYILEKLAQGEALEKLAQAVGQSAFEQELQVAAWQALASGEAEAIAQTIERKGYDELRASTSPEDLLASWTNSDWDELGKAIRLTQSYQEKQGQVESSGEKLADPMDLEEIHRRIAQADPTQLMSDLRAQGLKPKADAWKMLLEKQPGSSDEPKTEEVAIDEIMLELWREGQRIGKEPSFGLAEKRDERLTELLAERRKKAEEREERLGKKQDRVKKWKEEGTERRAKVEKEMEEIRAAEKAARARLNDMLRISYDRHYGEAELASVKEDWNVPSKKIEQLIEDFHAVRRFLMLAKDSPDPAVLKKKEKLEEAIAEGKRLESLRNLADPALFRKAANAVFKKDGDHKSLWEKYLRNIKKIPGLRDSEASRGFETFYGINQWLQADLEALAKMAQSPEETQSGQPAIAPESPKADEATAAPAQTVAAETKLRPLIVRVSKRDFQLPQDDWIEAEKVLSEALFHMEAYPPTQAERNYLIFALSKIHPGSPKAKGSQKTESGWEMGSLLGIRDAVLKGKLKEDWNASGYFSDYRLADLDWKLWIERIQDLPSVEQVSKTKFNLREVPSQEVEKPNGFDEFASWLNGKIEEEQPKERVRMKTDLVKILRTLSQLEKGQSVKWEQDLKKSAGEVMARPEIQGWKPENFRLAQDELLLRGMKPTPPKAKPAPKAKAEEGPLTGGLLDAQGGLLDRTEDHLLHPTNPWPATLTADFWAVDLEHLDWPDFPPDFWQADLKSLDLNQLKNRALELAPKGSAEQEQVVKFFEGYEIGSGKLNEAVKKAIENGIRAIKGFVERVDGGNLATEKEKQAEFQRLLMGGLKKVEKLRNRVLELAPEGSAEKAQIEKLFEAYEKWKRREIMLGKLGEEALLKGIRAIKEFAEYVERGVAVTEAERQAKFQQLFAWDWGNPEVKNGVLRLISQLNFPSA